MLEATNRCKQYYSSFDGTFAPRPSAASWCWLHWGTPLVFVGILLTVWFHHRCAPLWNKGGTIHFLCCCWFYDRPSIINLLQGGEDQVWWGDLMTPPGDSEVRPWFPNIIPIFLTALSDASFSQGKVNSASTIKHHIFWAIWRWVVRKNSHRTHETSVNEFFEHFPHHTHKNYGFGGKLVQFPKFLDCMVIDYVCCLCHVQIEIMP